MQGISLVPLLENPTAPTFANHVAFSELDKKKMAQVSEAVRFAFGQPGREGSARVRTFAEGGLSPLSRREKSSLLRPLWRSMLCRSRRMSPIC